MPAEADDTDAEKVYKHIAAVLADEASPVGPILLDPKTLPQKCLPPGKVIDLYMLYCASCDGHGMASRCTFMREWHAGWSKCLRFRKSSSHSLWKVCHLLRHTIRSAADMTQQAIASSKLLLHLRSQWADREIYWALRHQAKTCFNIISAISDGMDKSKFAMPRYCANACVATHDVISNGQTSCKCVKWVASCIVAHAFSEVVIWTGAKVKHSGQQSPSDSRVVLCAHAWRRCFLFFGGCQLGFWQQLVRRTFIACSFASLGLVASTSCKQTVSIGPASASR